MSLLTRAKHASSLFRILRYSISSQHGALATRRLPIGQCQTIRQVRHAHGVFKGLTESRITTPWIEALRKQQAGGLPTPKSPGERDMTPKSMKDSYHEVGLPLASEPWLSDTYLNASGRIRLGTLFMDLDAMAGIVSYKHTGEDVTVVTAACDRITIEKPPAELCDLVYSGQVTYATGRSSMEVTCRVSKARTVGQAPKDEDVFLTCMFTMVALDPATKKSTPIPPLMTSTPHEQHLFSLGETRSKQKKALSSTTLLQNPPNETESALIHSLWLHRVSPELSRTPQHPQNQNVHPMTNTKISTTTIMQPQFRNRHQFQVFGGFLMRHAYELAFSCCASFAHSRPTFVSLDPSRFMNPVPVGSVLYLTAVVAYCDPPLVGEEDAKTLRERPAEVEQDASSPPPESDGENAGKGEQKRTRVQIRVDSKVRDIEHGTSKPTGQFNFSFDVEADVKVMPQSYSEFMVYVDARRRAMQALGVEGEGAEGGKMGGDAGKGERITE